MCLASCSPLFGNILAVLVVSRQLEEHKKIMDQLEEDNEKHRRKVYKLEQQLTSEKENSAPGSAVDIQVHVKHKVMIDIRSHNADWFTQTRTIWCIINNVVNPVVMVTVV